MIKRSLLIGLAITTMHSSLLTILLGINAVGPLAEIQDYSYKVGGTILFLGIYLILFVGIFIGISFSKRANAGRITYREIVINGVTISFFTATTSVVSTLLFYEVFYPDYAELMGASVRKAMESQKIESPVISERVTETINYYSTFTQATFSAIGNFMTGIMYSLVLGVFMKK